MHSGRFSARFAARLGGFALLFASATAQSLATPQPSVAQETAAAARPAAPAGRYAKICMTCHKTVTPGEIRGNWDLISMKSKLLQLKVDNDTEVLYLSPDIQVMNAPVPGDLEKQLTGIKKGAEVMAIFEKQGNRKIATAVVVKPKVKVADNKLIGTAELEKLVSLGPQQGKYDLFDARPKPRFDEGFIPTARNLPFPAFDQQKGKLPQDKNALVVFYCSGVT